MCVRRVLHKQLEVKTLSRRATATAGSSFGLLITQSSCVGKSAVVRKFPVYSLLLAAVMLREGKSWPHRMEFKVPLGSMHG